MRLKVELEVIVPDDDENAFPQFWRAFVESFEGTDIHPIGEVTVSLVKESDDHEREASESQETPE